MPTPTADVSDLTDLASVESMLQLPTGNVDEPTLQLIITGVSDDIVEYTERFSIMAQVGVTETRTGNGQDRIAFLNAPVFAVSSLSVYGTAILAPSTPTGSGYLFDSEFIYLRGWGATPGFWMGSFSGGPQSVVIVESCGWLTPGQVKLGTTGLSGAPILPAGIKLAATEWAAFRYRQSKRIGETGTGMGTERVNYDLKDMPSFVK